MALLFNWGKALATLPRELFHRRRRQWHTPDRTRKLWLQRNTAAGTKLLMTWTGYSCLLMAPAMDSDTCCRLYAVCALTYSRGNPTLKDVVDEDVALLTVLSFMR